MSPVRLATIGLLALVAAGACGGGNSSSTAPSSTATVTGSWRGTATLSLAAGAVINISATLTQNGGDVTGTYSCSGQCLYSSGTIRGFMSGTILTAQIIFPDNSSCSAFNGTLSGSSLSGSYSCATPRGTDRGS